MHVYVYCCSIVDKINLNAIKVLHALLHIDVRKSDIRYKNYPI